MLDNTLQLLCEGEFEWGPDDTVPSLRADIVQPGRIAVGDEVDEVKDAAA